MISTKFFIPKNSHSSETIPHIKIQNFEPQKFSLGYVLVCYTSHVKPRGHGLTCANVQTHQSLCFCYMQNMDVADDSLWLNLGGGGYLALTVCELEAFFFASSQYVNLI